MTIDDQIRDEKLQYDINREAAKISALSSGKIDKYECLTGEEILPSNKLQIVEQTKFTYSPLRKAFEKQTKTTEDQGEIQIKTIQDNKKQLTNINDDYKNKLLFTMKELNPRTDNNNITYTVISAGEEFEFDKSADPLEFFNDIRTGKIPVEETKNLQKDYEGYLKRGR